MTYEQVLSEIPVGTRVMYRGAEHQTSSRPWCTLDGQRAYLTGLVLPVALRECKVLPTRAHQMSRGSLAVNG